MSLNEPIEVMEPTRAAVRAARESRGPVAEAVDAAKSGTVHLEAEVPASVARALARILDELAEGRAVAVHSVAGPLEEVTTTQAAQLLGVSPHADLAARPGRDRIPADRDAPAGGGRRRPGLPPPGRAPAQHRAHARGAAPRAAGDGGGERWCRARILMPGPPAVLDANVLFPFQLRNLLLHLAFEEAFTPLWSAQIVDECARALRDDAGLTAEQSTRLTTRLHAVFPAAFGAGHDRDADGIPPPGRRRRSRGGARDPLRSRFHRHAQPA